MADTVTNICDLTKTPTPSFFSHEISRFFLYYFSVFFVIIVIIFITWNLFNHFNFTWNTDLHKFSNIKKQQSWQRRGGGGAYRSFGGASRSLGGATALPPTGPNGVPVYFMTSFSAIFLYFCDSHHSRCSSKSKNGSSQVLMSFYESVSHFKKYKKKYDDTFQKIIKKYIKSHWKFGIQFLRKMHKMLNHLLHIFQNILRTQRQSNIFGLLLRGGAKNVHLNLLSK